MSRQRAWDGAMSNFKVVTDIAEIAQLNKELGRRLSTSFKVRRSRKITYAAGTVYYESAAGSAVRA